MAGLLGETSKSRPRIAVLTTKEAATPRTTPTRAKRPPSHRTSGGKRRLADLAQVPLVFVLLRIGPGSTSLQPIEIRVMRPSFFAIFIFAACTAGVLRAAGNDSAAN